jgi:excinuclease UvrABC nuclease subunit
MARWQTSKWAFLRDFESRPAVYAVYSWDFESNKLALVYIGSTSSLRERIASHNFKLWRYSNHYSSAYLGDLSSVEIKFSYCHKNGEWLMREHRLIERLQPRLNKRVIRKAA